LKNPPKNKIFIVGPPGLKTTNNKLVLELCDHLNYQYVSSGDLLRKEISKKTELGFKLEH
jgi:adenylate kinase family enzyme